MDMFNRLKGAIDSRIAEEQARQRSFQAPQARAGSNTRRQSARAASPALRPPRASSIDGNADPAARGPDPKEFDPEFVLADDDDASTMATTPLPSQSKDIGVGPAEKASERPIGSENAGQMEKDDVDATSAASSAATELAADIRTKLRKLDRLEPRYQELLRSYRIAHARVGAIELFEAALRENTPLTSINDPGALTEYLNQLNLKSDMVLDELKRVSTEKELFKQRLQESEKKYEEALAKIEQFSINGQRTEETAKNNNDAEEIQESETKHDEPISSRPSSLDDQQSLQSPKSSSTPAKSQSRTPSIAGFSIFSPKSKPADVAPVQKQNEEFCSYDHELPRLESEIKDRQTQIESLEGEVKRLKGDLAVARESTQSMVQTLEESMRDLNSLREKNERYEIEIKTVKMEKESQLSNLHSQLEIADRKIREIEAKGDRAEVETELSKQRDLLANANEELEKLQKLNEKNTSALTAMAQLENQIAALRKEIGELQEEKARSSTRTNDLDESIAKLRQDFSETFIEKENIKSELESKSEALLRLQARLQEAEQNPETQKVDAKAGHSDGTPLPTPTPTPTSETASNKKNKKKKKKGGKSTIEQESNPTSLLPPSASLGGASEASVSQDKESQLQDEVSKLIALVAEKDAAIERLSSKLKDEDSLREEIESLRDDLINLGQDHVAAKDRMKALKAEKSSLEKTILELEKELNDIRTSHAAESSGSAQAHKDLSAQFNELKIKATSLETDLAVARQLASSRFKDLTALRSVLQKDQTELLSLRKENTELKGTQTELDKKVEELQKIEVRHNNIRSELADVRRKMSEKESETKVLTQKISLEVSIRQKAEDARSRASQDLSRIENEKTQVNESLERASVNLSRTKEELASARGRIRDAEDAFSALQREADRMKEEIQLKTAQHASAESLMNSMRDQTLEMATQTKESRERCDSLEEEIADAHRLLNERSREAETMRRLLAEVEGRSDSRVREMKERLDVALEERDKAEDDASTAGRRRARELEESRNKLREAQRDLKRTEEEKEELEVAQRDWKKRREDLEQQSEAATKEAEEVRKAMGSLRDALDDSERQARDLEKQKAGLRRTIEDTQQRLERLQKSNKMLAEEVRSMQAKAKSQGSQTQSPRSSIDSSAARSKLLSPPPKGTSTPTSTEGTNGQAVASTDYLKNVLLQFLEQKDKKHQMQLIPVLGMLLHFNRQDETKWMAAITAR